jgi:hypothetical protein
MATTRLMLMLDGLYLNIKYIQDMTIIDPIPNA